MININLKCLDEFVWWSLFGVGGIWFVMIILIIVLVLGIFVLLGVIDVEVLSYEWVFSFVISIIGVLFIIGILVLLMWYVMYCVYYGMYDLKFYTGVVGKIVCYGFVIIIFVLVVVFIFMI